MFLRSHMSADTLSPLRLASSDRRVGGEPPAAADVPGKVSTSLSTSPFELLLQLLLLIALLASKTKMPSSPPAITPSIFSISVESSGKQPRDGATIQLCSRLVTISKFLVGASGMSDSTVRIAAGAVVCARAIFEGGDISIGPDTVVFSGARISCSKGAGPVVIGRGCVLEEGSSIECVEPGGLCVGEGNLFEVGCTVRSPVVGDYNVFQPKCVVDRSVKVASGCFIGPKVTLNVATTLPDNVSVFRLDAYPDEYRMQSRPKNTEYNRAKVNSYRTALASQGKKYSLGKYNQLLPSTTSEA